MSSVSNIVIGSAAENTIKVGEFDETEDDAVDLGLTDGGVEMTKTEETKEIFVDQHLGPVDIVTIKEGFSVKVNLSEATLANLAVAFGYATTAVTAATSFTFGDKTDMRDPKTVYINVKGPGPGTRKITLYKAKIKGDSANKYMKDDVTMIPIEIIAMCDTANTAGARMVLVADTGADTTAPTIALSSPVDGGTVAKDAKTTVVWTITETNGMDENTMKYGDTFIILNTTTPASAVLVAGTIAYNSDAKTVTFTPTSNWTAEDTLQSIVSTGLKDAAGNALAAASIEQFSVAA